MYNHLLMYFSNKFVNFFLDRAGTENRRVVVLRSILTRWEVEGCPNVFIVDGGFNAVQSHHPEMLRNPDVELAPDDPRDLNQSAVDPNFEYPLWYYRCWYKPEDIPKNIQKKIDKVIRKIRQKGVVPYDVIVKMLEEYSETFLGAHLKLEEDLVALNAKYLDKIKTDNTLKSKGEYEILYTESNKKREEFLVCREKYEEIIETYDVIEKYASDLYPISKEQLNRRNELMLQIDNLQRVG